MKDLSEPGTSVILLLLVSVGWPGWARAIDCGADGEEIMTSSGEEACLFAINALPADAEALQQPEVAQGSLRRNGAGRDVPSEDVTMSQRELGKLIGTKSSIHFLRKAPDQVFVNRLSAEGVALFLAFDASGGLLPLADALGPDTRVVVEVAKRIRSLDVNGQFIPVGRIAQELGAKYPDMIEIRVEPPGRPSISRYTYYRPISGFTFDFRVGGTGFAFPLAADGRLLEKPSFFISPGVVRLGGRTFWAGDGYFFAGVAFGPSLALGVVEANMPPPVEVTGLTAYAALEFSGVEIGVGIVVRIDYALDAHLEPLAVLPLFMFNVTAAVAQALGLDAVEYTSIVRK